VITKARAVLSAWQMLLKSAPDLELSGMTKVQDIFIVATDRPHLSSSSTRAKMRPIASDGRHLHVGDEDKAPGSLHDL